MQLNMDYIHQYFFDVGAFTVILSGSIVLGCFFGWAITLPLDMWLKRSKLMVAFLHFLQDRKRKRAVDQLNIKKNPVSFAWCAYPGTLWRHYKHPDRRYEVIGTGNHTETMERLVLYKETGSTVMWARPASMFFGTVITLDGKSVSRFTQIVADLPLE